MRNPFVKREGSTGKRGPYKVPRRTKEEIERMASAPGRLVTNLTPPNKVTMPDAADLLADHIKDTQLLPIQVINMAIEKTKRNRQGKTNKTLVRRGKGL